MSARAGREDDRIADLLRRYPPLADADAPARVRDLFTEMSQVLRVPFVGMPFRVLAHDPPLLESLWSAVREPLGLRYAEHEADRLHGHALFFAPASEMGALHRAQLHRRGLDERTLATIARMQATVHYGVARILLAVAAGAVALRGEAVGGAKLHRDDDARALARGVAPDTVAPDPIDDGEAPAAVRSRLDDLRRRHDHPLVINYFLALARWPAYLERVAEDLPVLLDSGRHAPAIATVATLAEVAAKGFPSAVKVEARGEVIARGDAAALLAYFHERLLPQILVDCAWLRALLEGERRARTSPFSLTA